jgi:cytochrome c biogenesis protein ResB
VPARGREMKPNTFERSWRWLARPGVLAVLVCALLALLLAGALLPQAPDVALDSARFLEWQALAQARYGALTPLLESVGAYRIYSTPLLWALLVLLGAATLACIVQRWHGYWHASFSQPVHLADAVLDAFSHTCILASCPGDDRERLNALSDLAVRAFSRLDYRVRIESTPDIVWLRGDRNRLAPLSALAEHLSVLIILAGIGMSLLFGWRETLDVRPGGIAEVGRGTGIVLRYEDFEITRYDDGSPAAYTVQVTVEAGSKTERRAIGVNRPAMAGRTRLYLQGYHPAGGEYVVTLLAVHDPGYGVVVGGAFLFLAGIAVALYCARSTVHLRITSDGLLRLSGWADPRAYDFDREFAEVAAGLGRELELLQLGLARPGTE